MLDAYIIDRIRREREHERDGQRAPLHIEVPQEPVSPDKEREDEREPERGSVVVDYHVDFIV